MANTKDQHHQQLSTSNSNEVQRLMDKVVHISKTFDPATRLPLVVIDSSQFPPSKSEIYSQMASLVLQRLPKNDYVVLFFACGAPNKPSWSWVAKTYSMLDRPTKKRIKKVYVVHESWWVRAVTEMLRGVVSSKFKRKIIHVGSLSQLAQHLDFTLLNIKPKVYIHNAKVEKQITIPRHNTPVFGVNIDYSYEKTQYILPRLWYDIFSYLRVTAPNTKGIFNNAEYEMQVALVHILKDAYDRQQTLDLDDYGPHITASLLKLYLYNLPNPILPVNSISLPLQDSMEYTLKVWENLPGLSHRLLGDLMSLLTNIVAHSSRTMQTPTSLAVCLAKPLSGVSSTNKEGSAIATRFCRNLIEFWPNICQRMNEHRKTANTNPFENDDTNNGVTENPFASPPHSRQASASDAELNIKKRSFGHKASSASMSSSQSSFVVDPQPFYYSISKNNSTPELRSEPPSLIDLGNSNNEEDSESEEEEDFNSNNGSNYIADAYISSRTTSTSSTRSTSGGSKTAMGPPPVPAKPKNPSTAASVLRPSQKPNIDMSGSSSSSNRPSRTGSLGSEKNPPPSPPPAKPRKFGPSSKSVAPTGRGKMVSELARLYEEKSQSAQILVQLDRSRSSKN